MNEQAIDAVALRPVGKLQFGVIWAHQQASATIVLSNASHLSSVERLRESHTFINQPWHDAGDRKSQNLLTVTMLSKV